MTDFESFWDHYPKKVAKQSALKAWDKATASVNPQQIICAAREYAESDVGNGPKQYIANPATWLNGGCWDDDRSGWRRNESHSHEDEIPVYKFDAGGES